MYVVYITNTGKTSFNGNMQTSHIFSNQWRIHIEQEKLFLKFLYLSSKYNYNQTGKHLFTNFIDKRCNHPSFKQKATFTLRMDACVTWLF